MHEKFFKRYLKAKSFHQESFLHLDNRIPGDYPLL